MTVKPTKMYNGPFGSYDAGTMGAVLNAACEQEDRPSSIVSNYVLAGNGVIYKHHGSKDIVATYKWVGEDIVFEWL